MAIKQEIPYVGKFWRGKILANERNLIFWMVKYWRTYFLDDKILANVTSGD